MTAATQPLTTSSSSWPLMPPRSTLLRMEHFDEYLVDGGPTTIIYKLMDAMCGTSGAGRLLQEVYLARADAALQAISFNELDFIFGRINLLSRVASETYSYNPNTDMLNSDQWDEVKVKDAQYRNRIKKFFVACNTGGTPLGIRQAIDAAISVDCDVYEVWRYVDSFGLNTALGRTPSTTTFAAYDLQTGYEVYFPSLSQAQTYVTSQNNVAGLTPPPTWIVRVMRARNEVVVRPHKDSLTPQEFRTCRDMIKKIVPVDSVMTISTDGLAVLTPVPVVAAASDSQYFEVQRMVTATPILATLPPPELLPIDLDPTEQWLFSSSDELAPYAAYNIGQESSYFYLVSGGARSPIDSVTYGTLQADGSVTSEPNFEVFSATSQYSDWMYYGLGDSPDNYPGGKLGLTPDVAPALDRDGNPYAFPFANQAAYIASAKAQVLAMGGIAGDDIRYKTVLKSPSQTKEVFTPDLAVAFTPPTKESTITSSWTQRRSTGVITGGGSEQVGIFTTSTS